MSKRSVQVPLDQARSQAKRGQGNPKKAASQPPPAAATTAQHKESSRRGASATFAVEPRPASGTPSRKSTRSSAHHVKAGVALKARQELRLNAPSSRQMRGS